VNVIVVCLVAVLLLISVICCVIGLCFCLDWIGSDFTLYPYKMLWLGCC